MRTKILTAITLATCSATACANGDEGDDDGSSITFGDDLTDSSTGDGDGDGDPTGDGDGDGDGDPSTGDGDGDPSTGDGDGDPSTGDGDGDPSTGDGDGEPGCVDNVDCWIDEVCIQGMCEWALGQTYAVDIYFHDGSPDCWDDGLESGCLADIYLVAELGDTIVADTPYHPGTEDVWFDAFYINPDGDQELNLRFWDYDEFSADDYMLGVCSGPEGECGPLSALELHNGYIQWTSGATVVEAWFTAD